MIYDVLIQERINKIKVWELLGFSSYAEKFDRTHFSHQARNFCEKNKKQIREVKDILESPEDDKKMCGRIMNIREMGKLAFLRIQDFHGQFQICLAKNILGENYKTIIKMLDLGDFCGFFGEFFITNHGEPTLLVKEVFPLAKSIRPLPEKWHGVSDTEIKYRHRELDLISNKDNFSRFIMRSEVVQLIREFFCKKDFLEIETPILQAQAGGAMAKVFSTYHNALEHEFVLRISLELDLKKAVAGGIERVFEIGKCFRNEGIDPSHLQEFTMLEWYAAYENLDKNMEWTQELIQEILQKILGTAKVEVYDKDDNLVEVDFSGNFPQVKFGDLLQKYAKIDINKISRKELIDLCVKKYEMKKSEAEKISHGNLLDHIYKKTARPNLIQPVFVLDYPSDLKPLARPNGDGTADCYQLLVCGWEIVNSYGELVDPQVQRKLLEEQAKFKEDGDEEAMEVDESFLHAMEIGMPPMTGMGMGIDRFIALITQQKNIKDTVLFPLMLPKNKEK